jgi:hypothetical protein
MTFAVREVGTSPLHSLTRQLLYLPYLRRNALALAIRFKILPSLCTGIIKELRKALLVVEAKF